MQTHPNPTAFGLPSDIGGRDFGVFLPMANGGWMLSSTTPRLDGSYAQNREIAVLADQIGLDFIMSMAKWKGYGGVTEHWKYALDSQMLMAALAEATSKVKVWTTVHTLLQNPAVTAKMMVTLDQISGGRAGLNIVTGAYKGEFEQMGAWRDGVGHDQRYDLAREWITAIKRLWSEDSVTLDGEFFTLKDCESFPKPASRPFLVCAGTSRTGMEFTLEQTDAIFLGGADDAELGRNSRMVKAMAAEAGRRIRTYNMITLLIEDTDKEAQAKADLYRSGFDEGALKGMLRAYGFLDAELGKENSFVSNARSSFMTTHIIGSAETVAERCEALMSDCELDGMMLIFPDYVQGLKRFAADILPKLRKTPVSRREASSPMPVEAFASRAEPLAAEPLAQMIDPARTALAVIDIQGDFAAPDGAMAKVGCDFSDVETVIDRAQALIAAGRTAGATMMFARVVTNPEGDAANLKALYRRKGYPDDAVGVCRAGTPGAAYYRVKPELGDIQIEKPLFSSFVGTDLEAQLRARGVDTLVFAGLTTDCCVDCTARDAFHRGFHVFVVEDACSAYGEDLHRAALMGLEKNVAMLTTTAEVVKAWAR